MYACGSGVVQVDGSQEPFGRPEVLAQFRSRIDDALLEERLAIPAAAALEAGLVSPAHLVVDPWPSEPGSPRVNEAATLSNAPQKVLQVIASMTAQGATRGTALQAHAQPLQHDLQQGMRCVGRQCRGMGHVWVTLVRQTETPWRERGQQVLPLARAVQACLHGTTPRSEDQRARLDTQLRAALEAHQRIAHQSRRLPQGQALLHGKIVHAYDPTMAPIGKGKRHCPAQCGRKPGMIAAPAAGFIFALQVPVGKPRAASSVLPLVDNVEQAIARVGTRPTSAIHSLAGALALNDAALREALPQQGMLTVELPKTIAPLTPLPTPEEVLRILNEAGLHRTRPPSQVHLACACGYSRPVVESIIASLLCRGAGRLASKGHRGAIVQTGMAHNAATLVRIHAYRLSKRARKLRRRLRLRCRKVNHCNAAIN